MTELTNRVICVFNHKTSMRLASLEWRAVDDICKFEHIKRRKLLEMIKLKHDPKVGFTGSVRLFALAYMHTDLNENARLFPSTAPTSDRLNLALQQIS